FLEPQRLYRKGREEVPDDDYTVPFGKVRLARTGSDVTLIAWSAAVEMCLQAADDLQREGVSAGGGGLPTLAPPCAGGPVARGWRGGGAGVGGAAGVRGVWAPVAGVPGGGGAFSPRPAPTRGAAPGPPPSPPASLEGWYLPPVRRVVEAARRTAAA